MTKELPQICPDGEHDFRPIEGVTFAACGWTPGAEVMEELLVLEDAAAADYVLAEGQSVCRRCFQVFGRPRGERNSDRVFAFEKLALLEG